MAKNITLFIIMLLCISLSFAQTDTDTAEYVFDKFQIRYRNNPSMHIYTPERGYFQKAFTDKSDPRFMVVNASNTFKFGIGGFVTVLGFCDFNGMVEHDDFVTSQIPVHDKINQGQFALNANNSRFNFKAVGSTKYGDLVGFIEADFRGNDNALKLRHAYISYFGFTIGQTWSTFVDLSAAPPTIDMEGPNTQISLRQPMIRYSGHFAKKFAFSVAMEMNTALVGDYPLFGVQPEYQRTPDFPLHLRYADRFGHLQLGGILRVMNYYDSISLKSRKLMGYGVALSGKFNLAKKTFLYFQSVYGEGIAQYIQDLSYSNLDMIPEWGSPGHLRTCPMYGGYLAIQQNWLDNLYSAATYSFTKLNVPGSYKEFDGLFDYTHYFAVNLFWDFIPYGTVGLEYLFGQRVNQTGDKGNANRINLMLRYGF